ncbi:hypothetical protein [Streptomyces sioyaensis]|uniref:hypothetical protein n=1 Tax=Streptomyces sioyaensis TaxID=67364 RepID=UPI0037234EDE
MAHPEVADVLGTLGILNLDLRLTALIQSRRLLSEPARLAFRLSKSRNAIPASAEPKTSEELRRSVRRSAPMA